MLLFSGIGYWSCGWGCQTNQRKKKHLGRKPELCHSLASGLFRVNLKTFLERMLSEESRGFSSGTSRQNNTMSPELLTPLPDMQGPDINIAALYVSDPFSPYLQKLETRPAVPRSKGEGSINSRWREFPCHPEQTLR